ncbi:MAG: hypothetical protein DELT_02680 [Desulfovibrio sp.]
MATKGFTPLSLFITRKRRPGPITWLALLFGVYCLILGAVLPHFARPFLEKALSEELGVHCAVEKLRVHPLSWKIIAKKVSVPYPHFVPGVELPAMPEHDFLRFERLEMFVEPSSLTEKALVVNELRLVKPRIAMTRYKDGTFSPQYFFTGAATSAEQPGVSTGGSTNGANEAAGEEAAIFPLVVRNVTMHKGSVLFKDELADATYDINNLDVFLPFASTLAADRETALTPTITALVNGQTLTATGETRPFAKTRQTSFTLKTRDFSLPELRGYLAPYTRLSLESGSLHTEITLRLGMTPNGSMRFALAGTLEVTDVAFKGPQGEVLSLKRGMADVENVFVGPRKIIINEAVFENPKAVFRLGKDGNLDWASFFDVPDAVAATDVRIATGDGTDLPTNLPRTQNAKTQPAPPHGSGGLPLRLVLGKARIRGGSVEWHDATTQTPVRYTAENIEGEFTDVSTEDTGRAEFSLSFGKGKETASIKGRATTAPMRAVMNVTLQNAQLAPFAPYIAEGNGFTLHGGTVNASSELTLSLAPEKTVRLANTALSIANVQVKDVRHAATPLFDVKKIEATGGSLDVAAKTLHVAKISGSGIAANIVRGKDGAIVLPQAQTQTPKTQTSGQTAGQTTPPAWKIAVASVHLAKSTVSFVDASLKKQAAIPLADVTFTGKDFANYDKKRWSVTAAGKPGGKGDLSVTATGTLAPLHLTFSGKMDNADIRPLSPYLQENTQLSLMEATLGGEFKGTLKRVEKSKRGGDFSCTGSLGLYGVSLVYNQREIIGWGRMRAENIAYASPANGARSLTVSSITVNAPRMAVTIDAKGENSLEKALRAPGTATAVPTVAKTPPAKQEPFLGSLDIGNAAVKQGVADYVDVRVTPPSFLRVNKVDLTLKNLTLDPKKSAAFNASLFINGSPITAKGSLASLFDSPSGNGTVTIRSLDLSRFTQYAAKYLGYPVDRGELTADITASLKGKRLDMRNKLVIRDLQLGKKTNSPHAPEMSLPTAVAALRDMSGVITLDLPVSGTLGDPQFRLSGIVSQMIGNVMVKTVATPFTLLGSLVTGAASIFTGGGPEEARIVFAQGGAALDKTARASLKKVGGELQKYKNAKMAVTGTADVAEKSLLVEAWVESRLRAMKYERLTAAQKQKTTADRVPVGPQVNAKEYAELLQELYNSLPFVKSSKDTAITSPGSTRAIMRNIRTHYPMTEKELILLADERAKAVYNALVEGNAGIASRVSIQPAKLTDSAKTGGRLEAYAHIRAVK